MSKALKRLMAQELTRKFTAVETFIVINYQGLKSQELFELRRSLLKEKVVLRVVKNKVASLSLAQKFPKEIAGIFKGPVAMVFGGDVVRVAQLLLEWNKKSPKKIEIKGGYIPGKVLVAKDIEALSKVPPRQVVLSMIAGGYMAPMRQIATIMVAPVQNLSYAINGVVKKMEENKIEKLADLK